MYKIGTIATLCFQLEGVQTNVFFVVVEENRTRKIKICFESILSMYFNTYYWLDFCNTICIKCSFICV